MRRERIKHTGGVLFVAGLVTLFSCLALSDYRLPFDHMRLLGTGEKYSALEQCLESLDGVSYQWSPGFVSELTRCFDDANATLADRYSIKTAAIDRIAAQVVEFPASYSSDWIEEAYRGVEGEPQQYGKKKLIERTSWMQGREYTSEQTLRKALMEAAKAINRSIVYEKGFSSYQMKTDIFTLTKASSYGVLPANSHFFFWLVIGLWLGGAALYFAGMYAGTAPGIKNDHIYTRSLTGLGWMGIALGTLLIAFYIVLYFYPEHLVNWVIMLDPLSRTLNGGPASHWFLYGFLYTFAVLVMGAKMIAKYRHSNYHLIRTMSVMFFQLAFAFVIPEILAALNKPSYDFKNIWPLDYDFFYGYNLKLLIQSGTLGWFILFWGIGLIIIVVPTFTYFYGKRWYCSWVCGCGGLAETLGDPFRHLSDKSLKAWKIERWLVHGVLVFAVLNTTGVLYTYFTDSYSLLGIPTETVKSTYGFLISSIFAGVIGTGFYPLMGNRVWCRFGCPLAAYLGLVQRFKSRFRITTNGGQCISCGNCSVYCEMGIDVRWYAQRGQNIVRASCVGCGICAAVCPRGVLRLENREETNRLNTPALEGSEILENSSS